MITDSMIEFYELSRTQHGISGLFVDIRDCLRDKFGATFSQEHNSNLAWSRTGIAETDVFVNGVKVGTIQRNHHSGLFAEEKR